MTFNEWKNSEFKLSSSNMKVIKGGYLSCACGNGSGFSWGGSTWEGFGQTVDAVCGSSNVLCQSV